MDEQVMPGRDPDPTPEVVEPEVTRDPGNLALLAIAHRLEAIDAKLARLEKLGDVAEQVGAAVKAEGLGGLLKLVMAARS